MSKESERKRIRKKVVEILKASNIVGKDVFAQRSVPTDHKSLPVILVYQKNESSELFSTSPKVYERNLLLELEIQTTHDTDDELADEMDDIAQQVEDVLEGTDFLYNMISDNKDGRLINEYMLQSSLYTTEGNGESPTGSVKIIYNFQYFTDEDRPRVLDTFKTMLSNFKIDDNINNDAKDVAEFDQE